MQNQSIGRNENDQQAQDVLERLRSLTRDLDTFVSGWTERLDRALECSRPVPLDDQGLQARAEQLQLERRLWESKRTAEQQVAKERIEQLTQAWLQLESEQRAFLQVKATQQSVGAVAVDANDPSMHRNRTHPTSVSLSKSIASSNTSLSSTSRGNQRDDCTRQFEKLRREIDSSRTDHRQP